MLINYLEVDIMKKLVSLGVATIFGVAMVVAGGGPAAADPYNCIGYKYSPTKTAAECSSGTGTYRATTICSYLYRGRIVQWRAYGGIVRVPNRSIADCTPALASIPDWQIISLR
jgi:hypothetical protein